MIAEIVWVLGRTPTLPQSTLDEVFTLLKQYNIKTKYLFPVEQNCGVWASQCVQRGEGVSGRKLHSATRWLQHKHMKQYISHNLHFFGQQTFYKSCRKFLRCLSCFSNAINRTAVLWIMMFEHVENIVGQVYADLWPDTKSTQNHEAILPLELSNKQAIHDVTR